MLCVFTLERLSRRNNSNVVTCIVRTDVVNVVAVTAIPPNSNSARRQRLQRKMDVAVHLSLPQLQGPPLPFPNHGGEAGIISVEAGENGGWAGDVGGDDEAPRTTAAAATALAALDSA